MHSITSKDIIIFRHHQQLITEKHDFIFVNSKQKENIHDGTNIQQHNPIVDTHMKKYSIPKPAIFTQLQDMEF